MNDPRPPEQAQKPHGRLDFIQPRLTQRILHARSGRGIYLGKRLRLWLPVLAGAVLLLLFVWPELRPGFIMKNVAKNIPNLVIDNLHYTGVDDKNEPYSLLAAQATHPTNMPDIYDLKKPEGEVTLQNGAWLDSTADIGRYDNKTRKLWLGGHVHIFHNKGYEFSTEEALVNLNNDEAWGDKPVLLQGGFGTVRGQGFRFLDSGKTVIIQGPAKATLYLHDLPGSDKPVSARSLP
ncbi:MAG: LPS export ABC transporter periplasmic protein LptC [Alphaproteobacteria bacterium]|nr:LPS export ABC transporter periplasmic protein LptC [Alphaproteobacteria bacterium]